MPDWASECGIKKAFGSRAAAMRTFHTVKGRKGWAHRGKGGKMHAYRCGHCSIYHLGHGKPASKPRRGHRTMASLPGLQPGNEGSIPSAPTTSQETH